MIIIFQVVMALMALLMLISGGFFIATPFIRHWGALETVVNFVIGSAIILTTCYLYYTITKGFSVNDKPDSTNGQGVIR